MRAHSSQATHAAKPRTGARQAQLDIQRGASAQHRAMVNQQLNTGKLHLIDGNKNELPYYAQDAFAGRVAHSQIGTRTKYQRLQQKNLQAKQLQVELGGASALSGRTGTGSARGAPELTDPFAGSRIESKLSQR